MLPAISTSLAGVVFWLAAVCCVIAQVALIHSAVSAPMAGSPESGSVRMPGRSSEIAWTIIPAIGLVLLLVFTWRATHQPASPDPHAGHQMINE